MFDQRFLSTRLGLASLVSVAAMVAFNIYAIAYLGTPAPELPTASIVSGLHVELA